jgi:hypothetical protein
MTAKTIATSTMLSVGHAFGESSDISALAHHFLPRHSAGDR